MQQQATELNPTEQHDHDNVVSAFRLPCPSVEAHAAAWTNTLLTKPTLATLSNQMALKGFAKKRGPSSRNILNWQRVYLVLQYPFVYYFDSNDAATRCLGLVYIATPCAVRSLPFYPAKIPHVLQIKPNIRRNLHHRSSHEDEDNFYFSFETATQLEEWRSGILQEQRRGETTESAAAVLPGDETDNDLADEEGDLREASIMQDSALRTSDSGTAPLVSILKSSRTPVPSSARNDGDENGSVVMEGSGDDDDENRSLLDGASSSTSSLLPRFEVAQLRRRSFFASDAMTESRNAEDFVHRVHCRKCRVSPIIGFSYTCVVCCADEHGDGPTGELSEHRHVLCGSCFRREDHDPRHLFLVSPDVEGESLRLNAPLEAWADAAGVGLRMCELLVFEALFRLMSAELDGVATQPIPKRRLLTVWNRIIGPPSLDDPSFQPNETFSFASRTIPSALRLSEGDLAQVCSSAESVTFKEFMLLVRLKLASPVAMSHLALHANAPLTHRGADARSTAVRSHDPSPGRAPTVGSPGKPLLIEPQPIGPDQLFVLYPRDVDATTPSPSHYRRAMLMGYPSPFGVAFSIVKHMVRADRITHSTHGDGTATLVPAYRFVWQPNADGSIHAVPPPGSGEWPELDVAAFDMLLNTCSREAPVDDPLAPQSEDVVPLAFVAQILRTMYEWYELSKMATADTAPPPPPLLDDQTLLGHVFSETFIAQHGIRSVSRGALNTSSSKGNNLLTLDEDDVDVSGEGLMESLLPVSAVRGPLLGYFSKLLGDSSRGNGNRCCLRDVVEYIMGFEVGGVFGLYTDQLESVHPHACDGCRDGPLVGVMLESDVAGNATGNGALRFCRQCAYRMQHPSAAPASKSASPPRSTEGWAEHLKALFDFNPSEALLRWVTAAGCAVLVVRRSPTAPPDSSSPSSPTSITLRKLPGGGMVHIDLLTGATTSRRSNHAKHHRHVATL